MKTITYDPGRRLQLLGDLLDGYIVDARELALEGEHDRCAAAVRDAGQVLELMFTENRRLHVARLHQALADRRRQRPIFTATVRFHGEPLADHAARVDVWVRP